MAKYKKVLITWSVFGVVGLAIFVLLYNHTFPVASIDVKINKEEALERSADFIQKQGFGLQGFNQTVIFNSNFHTSVYLQKTQGIKKSNEFIRQGIPVWFWMVRWFKELEKEGFLVQVDPATGEISYFHHFIMEDEVGLNLSRDEAVTIAKEKVTSQGVDLTDYVLKDSTIKKQKRRTDYNFSWEKKDYKIEDATLRIDVNIYGDKLGKYQRHLKIPEEFHRYLQKELSFGRMLALITNVLKYLLIITAVFTLLFQHKQISLNWRFWMVCGGIVALLKIFHFFNTMSLSWSFYPDTMSKAVFITESFCAYLMHVLAVGLIILACGTLGELCSHDFVYSKMPLYNAIKNRNFNIPEIMPVFIVGYSLGFGFLGYITLFYLIGTKFFNIWLSPETEYSNIFGMAVPFLFPLTVAVGAAVREEFMYRLFAISFLKKFIRKTWLVLLIPALLWGFAHSFYHIFPTYIRGIELTIFGLALGIVFLKYGLGTVVIAHFVINATLASLPLLRSHNPHYIFSGVTIIALAFIPIIIMLIIFKKGSSLSKK